MHVKESTMRLGLFLTTLAAICLLAFAPAFALESETESSDDDSTSSSQPNETETENDMQDVKEAKLKVQKLRDAAKARVAERRADHQEKSLAQRQKTCEHIQKAVNNKLSAFNNSADKYLTRLDDVFTKLQDYQSTNNLSVSDYDSLVTTATEQQSAATLAVQTLKDAGTTLDCTDSDPATMLTAAKNAASDARDALKAYRTSLKDIVVALAQSKDTATDDSTDGGAN